MVSAAPRFVLSYRREDAAGHAGRLADHLADRYGVGSVFIDVDSIQAGVDFTAEIERAIGSSEAVLVVIGPRWLDATTSSGARRLDDPGDFVRREIEAAFAADVRLIPVLVGGASMPAEEALATSIAELARRNAVELLDRRWREDVDGLVDVLEGRIRGDLGSLPTQATPFLGREPELADLLDLVRREGVRLITLTGPGGIGKTTLAIEAATKLAHVFAGGAWFVGLAELRDPDLVLAEVADALGAHEDGSHDLAESVASRFARTRTLLVLDNVEHLLPSASTSVGHLSSAAPSSVVLVSSREPLRLAAEHEVPVPVLSADDAIAMFSERARSVNPGFATTDGDDRAAVAAICDRLDRLPLAIELAASRIRILPPAELLVRLDQRLPLLTRGARDAPDRQRTLEATIAWSDDLLSDEERTLFESLSVFAGGWTLEAAEAVCGADLETLQSLVERSLIRFDGSRYVMLQTIHEFAASRFEARPDAMEMLGRHARFRLAEAEAASEGSLGPDRAAWLDRSDAELDNDRAVLRWALDGGDPELGLRMIVSLFMCWYTRRSVTEIQRWLLEAIEPAAATPSALRARALGYIGLVAEDRGEPGVEWLEESIRCARAAGADDVEAFAMNHLALALPDERRDEVLPLTREAVQLARRSGVDRTLASALNNLGEACRRFGDLEGAAAAYEEALEVLRDTDNAFSLQVVLVNLAEVALMRGDISHARTYAADAIERSDERGFGRIWSVAALGWAALAERDPDGAEAMFLEALDLARELDLTSVLPSLFRGLAGVAALHGDVPRAVRLDAAAAHVQGPGPHEPSAEDAGIHQAYLDELRARTDPTVWATEERAGESMNLDAAMAYALG